MGTANNPYGSFLHTGLSSKEIGAGITTSHGTLLPPGGRLAAFVNSAGARDYDSADIQAKTVKTLAAALRHVRSGLGDIVYVLPGHSENVVDATMLDNLPAGTRIIGAGSPTQDDAPRFVWTATAGQWTLDQKNVSISGLRLDFTGITAVVAAISVTAADCSMSNCLFITSAAAVTPTLCISVGAGGNGFTLEGCRSQGTADAAGALVSVATSRNVRILGNRFIGGHTATVGFVTITGAALDLNISDNEMMNSATASTACISVANAASAGMVSNNCLGCTSGGTSAAEGILITGASSLLRFCQNFNTSDALASGVLTPAAAT